MKKIAIRPIDQTRRSKIINTLIAMPFVLAIAGLFFVFEASYIRAFSEYGDSFHYLKVQAIWIVLGGCVMFLLSLFDYHKWYYLAFYAMLGSLGLLFLVLIPGIGSSVGGARRWIFGFQPAELVCLYCLSIHSVHFPLPNLTRIIIFLPPPLFYCATDKHYCLFFGRC